MAEKLFSQILILFLLYVGDIRTCNHCLSVSSDDVIPRLIMYVFILSRGHSLDYGILNSLKFSETGASKSNDSPGFHFSLVQSEQNLFGCLF